MDTSTSTTLIAVGCNLLCIVGIIIGMPILIWSFFNDRKRKGK